MNTVVEVKLCKSDDNEKNNEKKIISEINDDIVTYKKKYSNVIFAIYDLGIIRNQDQFKADIEANSFSCQALTNYNHFYSLTLAFLLTKYSNAIF